MISYQDGTEMKVGDSVLIEHGSTPGVITGLVESATEQCEFNVQQPGVMIKSAPFGLVFIPTSTFADDSVHLVEHASG